MTTVAITPRGFRSNEGRHKALLRDHGLSPRYPAQDRPLTVEELSELVAGCRAAIVGLDDVSERILATPGLEILVRFGAGADNVDLLAARRHGVKVATIPGATATSVAELALGLMLAAARRILPMDRSVRQGSWQRQTGFELSGRCLGLVGAGRIGQEVAVRAKALGMDVIAFDPFAAVSPLALVTFEELLSRSDVISIHAPLTSETAGLFDANALAAMRPGSVLVNTARGGIIDEAALAAALKSGPLSAAALDSFADEPTRETALFELENIVLTPHCGATTVQAVERAGVMAVEEVLRALAGRPMLGTID
ncbi:phosphoglycerate dehydrogenase [Arthrobacter sp. KN11-1C]|uniref:phosphoglycerate dehydrogenase n=1 Tax=Arthrobacter sp. KN11-1C TaxID=3445774 RepID=UPI003F9FEA4F